MSETVDCGLKKLRELLNSGALTSQQIDLMIAWQQLAMLLELKIKYSSFSGDFVGCPISEYQTTSKELLELMGELKPSESLKSWFVCFLERHHKIIAFFASHSDTTKRSISRPRKKLSKPSPKLRSKIKPDRDSKTQKLVLFQEQFGPNLIKNY